MKKEVKRQYELSRMAIDIVKKIDPRYNLSGSVDKCKEFIEFHCNGKQFTLIVNCCYEAYACMLQTRDPAFKSRIFYQHKLSFYDFEKFARDFITENI